MPGLRAELTAKWALLAAFVALCVGSLSLTGTTFDEPAHLAAGLSYWRTGDFYALNSEHPPLFKLLCALPLVWMNVSLSSYDGEQYAVGTRLLDRHRDALFWARMPAVLAGFLLLHTVWYVMPAMVLACTRSRSLRV
jgi:hypothetical protein